MKENYLINETNFCGKCPECDYDWDRGEAVDVVMQRSSILENTLPEFKTSRTIAEKTAKERYGWTSENKKHISHLVRLESSDGESWDTGQKIHYQCPNCNVAWDSETGERTEKFKGMLADDAKMKELIEKLRKGTKN